MARKIFATHLRLLCVVVKCQCNSSLDLLQGLFISLIGTCPQLPHLQETVEHTDLMHICTYHQMSSGQSICSTHSRPSHAMLPHSAQSDARQGKIAEPGLPATLWLCCCSQCLFVMGHPHYGVYVIHTAMTNHRDVESGLSVSATVVLVQIRA